MMLVEEYDPEWSRSFEKIKEFLEEGLGDSFLSIEHIGSTSIKGMVAKPIIDIDIVIKPGSFPATLQKLEVLGYLHQGDLGIKGREAFDLKDEAKKQLLPKHHMYVCQSDSEELKRHLAFKKYLEKHPEMAKKLSIYKKALAVKYNNDLNAYINGKSELVSRITAVAMKKNKG